VPADAGGWVFVDFAHRRFVKLARLNGIADAQGRDEHHGKKNSGKNSQGHRFGKGKLGPIGLGAAFDVLWALAVLLRCPGVAGESPTGLAWRWGDFRVKETMVWLVVQTYAFIAAGEGLEGSLAKAWDDLTGCGWVSRVLWILRLILGVF